MRPIKRHERLKPISREHHHGLLLCWKLRQGTQKKVAPERMIAYCQKTYQQQLLPHFALEEEAIFPILGNDHPLAEQALEQHRRLIHLFMYSDDPPATRIAHIAKELDEHIRFEERVLFNEIEAIATEEQLARVSELHDSLEAPDQTEEQDAFWE